MPLLHSTGRPLSSKPTTSCSINALSVQCKSLTVQGARCSRWTNQGDKCAQHLRVDDGLAIAPSTIAEAGLGLFTTVARRKGERIVPYRGRSVHLASADERYGGVYVLQLTATRFIDAAAPSSGAGRYSNTARKHNIARQQCRGNNAHFTIHRATNTAWITATRNIRAGEEVFTAYGSTYRLAPPQPRLSEPRTPTRRRRNSV
jgi:hypothetical protein